MGDQAVQSHAAFIWSVADLLRGDYKQSEYGKVILPLVVIRRLDCVLEPTKAAVLKRYAALAGRSSPHGWHRRGLAEPTGERKAGDLRLRSSCACRSHWAREVSRTSLVFVPRRALKSDGPYRTRLGGLTRLCGMTRSLGRT